VSRHSPWARYRLGRHDLVPAFVDQRLIGRPQPPQQHFQQGDQPGLGSGQQAVELALVDDLNDGHLGSLRGGAAGRPVDQAHLAEQVAGADGRQQARRRALGLLDDVDRTAFDQERGPGLFALPEDHLALAVNPAIQHLGLAHAVLLPTFPIPEVVSRIRGRKGFG